MNRLGILLFFFCIACLSCKAESSSDSCKVTDMDALFIYKNDTIEQKLYVKEITNNKIQFTYCINNSKSKTTFSLTDIAIGNTENDTEAWEDEEGTGYVATKFTYRKNGCILELLFDIETYTLGVVVQYTKSCQAISNVPLSSGHMRRKTGTLNFR